MHFLLYAIMQTDTIHSVLHCTEHWTIHWIPPTRTFIHLNMSRLEKELSIVFLVLGCLCKGIGTYYLNSR